MKRDKRYKLAYRGRSVELSKANSSSLVYRIPYQNLNGDEEVFKLENPFVVYILYGKNDQGRDVIYVGKSKNGLKNRQTAHEDKFNKWTYCYILTQFKERTFFNDGTIQYLEDKLKRLVDEVDFYINTTQKTSQGTANRFDEEDCDEYLDEVIEMLDVLGLDLITHHDTETDERNNSEIEDKDDINLVPDGTYTLSRKMKRMDGKPLKATMQVSNGHFIVLKGSIICEKEGVGLRDGLVQKRRDADIVNGILKEDVAFESPSGAGSFVVGAACNGWQSWKNSNGEAISIYKKSNRT